MGRLPLPLRPRSRRVVQAVLYEAIALALVGPAMAWLFERPAATTFWLAAVMSTIALGWSWAFNSLFERWESGRATRGRSLARRVAHGAGFEGGLVVLLVPVMAVGLGISLREAFVADLGVLVFFFVYSIAFTWAFDKLFGLPPSAS